MKKMIKKMFFRLAFNKQEREEIRRAVQYSAYKYKMHGHINDYEVMQKFYELLLQID